VQLRERPVHRDFLLCELNSISGWNGCGIEDIDIGAPVVPTGTGECGITQYAVEAIFLPHRCQRHDTVVVIKHRPLAGQLLIPDSQLPLKRSMRAGDLEIEAHLSSISLQASESTQRIGIQKPVPEAIQPLAGKSG